MEWIDPKYAELVATMRRAQADASEQDPSEDRPVRGFIVPDTGPDPRPR
ncbi:hypothetical protein [Streptomyces himastatinicus]|nr:hypothetical protein [Streptomyces himastatinicus]